MFIPGLGCVLGSLVTGRLMDWEYKRVAILYREAKGLEVDEEIDKDSHPDFPLEKARLASTWWLLLLFCVSTGVYGYATQWHIAVPLIMQFICRSKTLRHKRVLTNAVENSCIHCNINFQCQLHHHDRLVSI